MSATTARKGPARARRLVAVLVGVAVGLGGGLVAAANLGAAGGVIEVGTAVVRPGCTGTPSIQRVQSAFTEADGYWVDTVRVTSVGGNCRAPSTYVAGVTDESAGFPLLGEWEGTAPSGNSGDLTSAAITDGAPIDLVNAANDSVRVFYVTETP